jgi:hypothetical protein
LFPLASRVTLDLRCDLFPVFALLECLRVFKTSQPTCVASGGQTS